MFKIENNKITLTRGDTLIAKITITTRDGQTYIPNESDSIRFAMKKTFWNEDVVLQKEIPVSTMLLRIEPEDTKKLRFGEYVYDIQLTKEDGIVDTFIAKGHIRIDEEVM